jgi:hypothetical protein
MAARETYVWDPDLQKLVTKAEFQARDRGKRRSTPVKVKQVERGSWVMDPVTCKLIPKHLWHGGASSGVQIIRDIDPYRTVAADTNGKRITVGGRRQHREFLKRNGYIETGNEMPRNNLQFGPRPGDVARDIKRVLGE